MRTGELLDKWNEAYTAELKKRGGEGFFGSNLTASDHGACARVADAAAKEAAELARDREAAA